MPVSDFDGETFVAFMDIWAFRSLMTKRKAIKALNSLYNYGYGVLSEYNSIRGIFVSDSGILFVKNTSGRLNRLKDLLTVIKEINKKMMNEGFILTTSITFGEFRYKRRMEHSSIQKIPIYGHGYVSAWLDNEKGKPKMKPGQCRIFTKNIITEDDEEKKIHVFPNKVESHLTQIYKNNSLYQNKDNILSLIKKYEGDDDHYYFYWMVNNYSEIDEFEYKFRDIDKLRHSKEKYEKILKILHG